MIFKQYKIISGIICCLLLINVVKANLLIGDFETPDSFKQTWRAKRGVWGGSFKMKLTQLNSTSGHYALQTKIKGSINNTWPYLEYRFPKDQQELDQYKFLRMNIFNAMKETYKLQGFFSMLSSRDKDKYVRVYFSHVLNPGANILKINLSAKSGNWEKKAKDIQPVNWKNVDRLQLFFNCPRKDIRLFIDGVTLLKNDSVAPIVKAYKQAKISHVKGQQLTKPIKLDGKLDKEEWNGVPRLVISSLNSGQPTQVKTTLRAAYDSSNLYLGIVFDQNNMAKIKAPVRKHDGNIWADENVEIFLQNVNDGENNYYQLALNAAGSRYDGKIANRLSDPSWDRPWKAAVFKRENFWSCELKIPWRIFDFVSSHTPRWRINVLRNNSVTKETTALSPTYGSYHRPEKFIPLRLFAPDLNNYCVNIKDFKLDKMILGKNHCLLTLNCHRQGNFFFHLLLRDEAGKTRIVSRKVALTRGSQKVKIPFEQNKAKTLKAKIFIENSKKMAIAESRELTVVMAPALTVKVVEPHYRNTIFGGQKIEDIVIEAKVNVRKKYYKKLKIKASLKDSKSQILSQKKLAAKSLVTFKFPTIKLLHGDYFLLILLEDEKNNIIAQKMEVIKNLPFHSGQVTVGKNNFIEIDNKPFFPILLYTPIYEHLDMLREIGFNTALIYAGWASPEKERKVIEKLGAKGFYVMVSIGVSILQKNRQKSTFKEMKPKLDRWISGLKKSKNLLLYETLDEPNIHHKGYNKPYLQAYNYIKELDPYHPMLLVQCGEIHMPAEHAEFTDIYEFDYYPGYKLYGSSLQPLNAVAVRTRSLRAKLNDSKPIWTLFQGFDRSRLDDKFNTGRISNYLETRALFYSSIAEGATGLGFWCYAHRDFGCMVGRPNWLGIVKNVQELNQLMPIIIAPRITRNLICSAPDNKKFHYIVKNYKGYFYIIAASTNENAVKVDFSGDLLKGVKELKVLGEDRTLKLAGIKFIDHFKPYYVHIYTNDPMPLKIANIASNQQECLEYKQKIKDQNKNNILHQVLIREKYKIKVKTPTSGCKDYFIFDGLRNSCWFINAGKLPAKLSVSLENPKKMNRIVILSSDDYIMQSQKGVIRDFSIMVKSNNKWKELKRITNNKSLKMEIKFPVQEISDIQLIINKTNGKRASIDELEAYCD